MKTVVCDSAQNVEQYYVMVRGLTGVWELKGEGPCWNGLGLCPSGVAGEVLGCTLPTGWMAPGRVWKQEEKRVLTKKLEVKSWNKKKIEWSQLI